MRPRATRTIRKTTVNDDGSSCEAQMIKSAIVREFPRPLILEGGDLFDLQIQRSSDSRDDPVDLRLIDLGEEMSQSLAP